MAKSEKNKLKLQGMEILGTLSGCLMINGNLAKLTSLFLKKYYLYYHYMAHLMVYYSQQMEIRHCTKPIVFHVGGTQSPA